MEQARVSDRRVGGDRRKGGTSTYTGPERRILKYRRTGLDRRDLLPAICMYCGKTCGDQIGWSKNSVTIETSVETRMGICTECSSRKFPQFYSDN
jgi:hypothetical protein